MRCFTSSVICSLIPNSPRQVRQHVIFAGAMHFVVASRQCDKSMLLVDDADAVWPNAQVDVVVVLEDFGVFQCGDSVMMPGGLALRQNPVLFSFTFQNEGGNLYVHEQK